MSKFLASVVALAMALAASFPAPAQDKTLRFVLGFPAGAASDTLTRLRADYDKWGPVIKASGFKPES